MSDAAHAHGHHDDHLHDYTKGENAFNYFDYATAAGVDYLGERSAGHQDPGATSSYLLLKSFAETMASRAASG